MHDSSIFTAASTHHAVNGIKDTKKAELFSNTKRLDVEFKRFFGVEPSRVDRRFTISLAEQTYLPKVDHPRADWAVIAAFNSFQAFQHGQLGQVRRFATVGTGSGTDVIAAIETFPELEAAAMTDLHESVVETAKRNVMCATERSSDSVRNIAHGLYAAAGDVLLPLRGQEQFDLIYENLPNIPLPANFDLSSGQTSSTYIGDRRADRIPPEVSTALLDLHYVCLRQADSLGMIKSTGAVLSSIGGRVPLQSILNMIEVAGFTGRVVSLSWKVQSEPESVIGDYAKESGVRGEYYFYPTVALEKVFGDMPPATAALHAWSIEEELFPYRLDAVTALEKHRSGVEIGHPVFVFASVLKRRHNEMTCDLA